MAYIVHLLLICCIVLVYGKEFIQSPKMQTTIVPKKPLIDGFLSFHQNLSAQHLKHNIRNTEITFKASPTHHSVLNGFINQLYSSNRTSSLYKPSQDVTQDEQQTPAPPGPIQLGLGNFLAVLSSLSNRPLSDQSTGSTAGIISGGLAAAQEAFSQVGSNIQNGINSVFGSNQPNEVSASASWNPDRPFSSAFASSSTSRPSFCPTSCTMLCGIAQKAPTLRVLGGADVKPSNKYPWIALIQYYVENVGTGTLINDRVVLTSATIISNMIVYKQIKVIFGAFDPNSTQENGTRKVFAITKTRLHPQYSSENQLNYNIGLLQLAVPVTITDRFMPICLPANVNSYADTEAVLAGWGARELGGQPWKSLQETTIPLYSNDECRLAFVNATEDIICGGVFGPAPKEQHKTPCDGDGGAGLMLPWTSDPSLITLIGINIQISGTGCGRTNEPAVFTKLYQHIPWVQSQATGCYCKS